MTAGPAEGLEDGLYALVVNLDYADRIWESDNGDNVVEVIVQVEDDVSRVSVLEVRRS